MFLFLRTNEKMIKNKVGWDSRDMCGCGMMKMYGVV